MTDQMVTLAAPEVRTFAGLALRDVDVSESLRWMEGRAVPYGVWQDVGWYQELIRHRCFAKSIQEAARRLPLLLWHDNRTFPIGVSEQWTETEDGLDVVWRIDSDETSQEAARKAAEGMMTGLSVGFAPIRSEQRLDDDGVLWIERLEARLLEVSLTPTPAYAGAHVQLVRSREPRGEGRARRSSELDALRSWLDEHRR